MAEAGFDAIWASGFELSAMYGVPDVSIVSMTQHLDMTRAMVERSGLPVVADIDTGFGNSINVLYVVEQYERAGVAAIVMEDKKIRVVRPILFEVDEIIQAEGMTPNTTSPQPSVLRHFGRNWNPGAAWWASRSRHFHISPGRLPRLMIFNLLRKSWAELLLKLSPLPSTQPVLACLLARIPLCTFPS